MKLPRLTLTKPGFYTNYEVLAQELYDESKRVSHETRHIVFDLIEAAAAAEEAGKAAQAMKQDHDRLNAVIGTAGPSSLTSFCSQFAQTESAVYRPALDVLRIALERLRRYYDVALVSEIN